MSKYRTLITTQYLENYGAHSENGKFEDGNAAWKFKGGEQYVISTDSHREANAVAFLSAYLQKENNSCHGKELITSWEFLPFGWVEEDMMVEGQEEFFRSPFYIDIEEYMELQKKRSVVTDKILSAIADKSDPGPVEKSGYRSNGPEKVHVYRG